MRGDVCRTAHAIVLLLCSFYCSIISVNGFLIGNGNSIRYFQQQQSFHEKIVTFATSDESLIRSPSSLSNDNTKDEMVYARANIDYSAANEYIKAHYNQSNYFATSTQDGASLSIVEHEIYNGRVLQSSQYNNNGKEMLINNGLAIIQSPLVSDTIDWSNMIDIQSSYLPKLEWILHNLFPTNHSISYCFWNPMSRGTELEISRAENGLDVIPTANIASLVHIDTDVGAHDIEDLINIVDKNKVQSPTQSSSNKFNKENVANDIIQNNKRFAIINFWRNIDEEPVSNSPLTILSTRYDNDTKAFPNVSPNLNKSKWYTFPHATNSEVIVFYQYDRNVQQPSDLWHCAISTPATESCTKPRKSFDIRAFVLLDECVSDELDRFRSDRTRPILNFEESGCFCDAQAEKREKESSD